MHPNKVKGYREVVRTLRMIGREWIQKRIDAMEKKERVPNDVLTRTIELASKFIATRNAQQWTLFCAYIESRGAVDIETLVDNFMNFNSGGKQVVLMSCISAWLL